jgi:hypothetical protein
VLFSSRLYSLYDFSKPCLFYTSQNQWYAALDDAIAAVRYSNRVFAICLPIPLFWLRTLLFSLSILVFILRSQFPATTRVVVVPSLADLDSPSVFGSAIYIATRNSSAMLVSPRLILWPLLSFVLMFVDVCLTCCSTDSLRCRNRNSVLSVLTNVTITNITQPVVAQRHRAAARCQVCRSSPPPRCSYAFTFRLPGCVCLSMPCVALTSYRVRFN